MKCERPVIERGHDDWSTRPRVPMCLHLSESDIHIVRIELDSVDVTDEQWTLLDEDERRRAERFVHESDRRRFVVAHALTRIILGRCVSRLPQSLRFAVASHGKPTLAEPSGRLRFNLSHAGDLALLAISHDHELGVDIECDRPIEALDLASRFFSPGEYIALSSLPPQQRQEAFFRCWSRKESFIKALGDGLSFPLDGFEVSLADEPTDESGGQILLACQAAPIELERWTIASLPIDRGYTAAVTASGRSWEMVRWQQPESVRGRGSC